MELTIWEKALDDAIRSAEMLVRKLKALKSLGGAEEKLAGSVSAAKLSEGVTLRVRSLPGHTGHPLAREHLRSAIREAVPVELGFTEQGWFCLRMPMRCRHYYCSAAGTVERTEVYLVPRTEYHAWLELENHIPDIGISLLPEPPKGAEKDA